MKRTSNIAKLAAAAVFLAAPPLASPALAAPSEIADTIHAVAPYGSGDYSLLFIPVYTATLWTDAEHWTMDAPFALTLRFDMGSPGERIVSHSQDEMRHVDPALKDADLETYGAEMTKVFPDMRKGDELTALYVPGKPVRFFKNGMPTGTIADPKFASDFFAIWLSPQTSAPSLRTALLKQK